MLDRVRFPVGTLSARPTRRRRWIAGTALLTGMVLVAGCSGADSAAPVVITATTTVGSTTASTAESTAPTTGSATSRASATPRSTARSATPSRSSTASSPAAPPAPQAFVTPDDVRQAQTAVGKMSDAELAGSVIMASSADAVGTQEVAQLHLGGVILMGENGIPDGTSGGTPDEVKAVTGALQRQSDVPILIGTDQEYGDVTRLVHGFTEFPGASRLAAIEDTSTAVDLTTRIAQAAGTELRAVGLNVDFAPDADVLPGDGSSSAIGNRSYGTDPDRVGELVTAAVSGYQSSGLAATLKHFPGIGTIASDTHTSLPSLDVSCKQWNAVESVPMAAGVKANVALVMTGHVELPAVGVDGGPTSLSASAVTDLLKGTGKDGCRGLGFTGVTVTDSLQMAPVADNFDSGGAAVTALNAGQDLLLMPVKPEAAAAGIVAALKSGKLSRARLVDAATRVYALRLAVSATPQPSMDVINSQEHQDLAAEAANAAG
jgi:beta-N-acetylhexosaminidase